MARKHVNQIIEDMILMMNDMRMMSIEELQAFLHSSDGLDFNVATSARRPTLG